MRSVSPGEAMKSTLFNVAVTLVVSVSLHAQWLNYPTRGVPRTADGKPNLAAPAPRMPDGKPDLSGIWQLDAPSACPGCQVDYTPAPEFLNLGAKLPAGSRISRGQRLWSKNARSNWARTIRSVFASRVERCES
jgi:hypothetical protein